MVLMKVAMSGLYLAETWAESMVVQMVYPMADMTVYQLAAYSAATMAEPSADR